MTITLVFYIDKKPVGVILNTIQNVSYSRTSPGVPNLQFYKERNQEALVRFGGSGCQRSALSLVCLLPKMAIVPPIVVEDGRQGKGQRPVVNRPYGRGVFRNYAATMHKKPPGHHISAKSPKHPDERIGHACEP